MNDVLCYISTSRHSNSHNNIILIASAFYREEDIKTAKDIVFGICKEKPPIRKASNKNPNTASKHIEDILVQLEAAEKSKVTLPNFVAQGYSSLPPAVGFDAIASVMCAFRDEVSALRIEVCELRQTLQRDLKSFEGVTCVQQDVAEIKLLLHEMKSAHSANRVNNEVRDVSSPHDSEVDLARRVDDLIRTSNLREDESAGMHRDSNPNQREEVNDFNVAVNNRSEDHSNQWDGDIREEGGLRRNLLSVGRRRDDSRGVSGRGGGGFGDGDRGGGDRGDGGRGGGDRRGGGRRGGGRGGGGLRDGYLRGAGQESAENGGRGQRDSYRGGGARTVYTTRGNRQLYVEGSKEPVSGGLMGVERVQELFVAGCNLDTTEKCIIDYCADNGVVIKKCESLVTKSMWYTCFKLSVTYNSVDTLLDSEFWPNGVFLRRYYKPRRNNY